MIATRLDMSSSVVVDRINGVYQEKIVKWKTILGSCATPEVVAIEKFDGNSIGFEGSKIEVLKNIQGDADENTMLWIPGQRILIAGDVVFNSMHVYTAETDSKARGKWLNSINRIRERSGVSRPKEDEGPIHVPLYGSATK